MGTFTNTFENGMRVDKHALLQENSTVRHSMGGRINWNRMYDPTKSVKENMEGGNSRVFMVARGNRYLITLPAGYKVVGSFDKLDGTWLFLTNGKYSEIGWMTINDNLDSLNAAKYVTRYNDQFDPNYKNDPFQRRKSLQDGGDLLNFNQSKYIHGFNVKENEFTDRTYIVDGYNQKRVINQNLFFDDKGNPYHPENALPGAFISYPKHLSAHAMDVIMDLVFPKCKFVRRVLGQLKSGIYQIVYKYISVSGHSSVWSPIDGKVFVTDQKIDGALDGVANVYKQNHHNRFMGVSNRMTEEGLEYELKGVDTRWDYIEVAYIYFATSVAFQECNAFAKIEIKDQTSIKFQLTKHSGTAVTKSDLNRRNETVLSVGTTQEIDNRSWDGDLELLPDLQIDLKGVTIEPITRLFRPDDTREPTFIEKENKVSGRKDNDPITNTSVQTGEIRIQNFDGEEEIHVVNDDYMNYKGQQFCKLLTGYPRGETQPFALLFLDRKGNPLFAQHIQDFTFPNLYDGEQWTLSAENADGKFDLRILGAKISGITIPVNVLYDKFGKLNISGFMIVRMIRIPRIMNQGVIVNTVQTNNGKSPTDNDYFIQPQLMWDNSYRELPGGSFNPDGDEHDVNVGPNQYQYWGAMGTSYKDRTFNNSWNVAQSVTNIFNYHSPDLLIERQISEKMRQGYFENVGFAHKAYSERVAIGGTDAHFYSKLYRSTPIDFPQYRLLVSNGRPRLGDRSRIKLAFFHDKGPLSLYPSFDPDQTGDDNPIKDYRGTAHAWIWLYWYNVTETHAYGSFYVNETAWHASQQPYSLIVKLLDYKAVDVIENSDSRSTHRIANWSVTPDNYYGDEGNTSNENSSLETRRYISTGHYQPITPDFLSKIIANPSPSGHAESYTINGIHIWGGDHYVNLFDFTRLYPQYTDCVRFEGQYPDYSVSMIVPNESKYNLALMAGRRFAANAVMPQKTSCNGELQHLSNGVGPQQPEDWNYNEVLLLQEATKFYPAKPSNIKIISQRISGFSFSPKKLYGELEDSYRQQLPNDFADALGQYGRIQRFGIAFNSLYVVQETGFGRIRTNLNTVVPTEGGEELTIKSGSVFGGVEYISHKYGTQHRNSYWNEDNQMGFTDARQGKLIVFAQNGFQPESQRDELDDPIMLLSIYFDRNIIHNQDEGQFIDIIAGYDNENKQAYTTFVHKTPPVIAGPNDRVNEIPSMTVVYDREGGFFHGYQPFTPYIYIRSGRYFLSPDNEKNKGNELYVYNHGKYGQWFGKYYDTVLEFIVSPQPNVSKTFDNASINVNREGYERISEIIHEIDGNIHKVVAAVNTGSSIIRPDDRVQFSEGSLWYPMHELDPMGEKARLTGKSLKVRIVIDNSQQKIDGKDISPVIVNFDTIFRVSYPIQYR